MKKRKIAMLVMTGVLLTGCMGTNYLEEGVSQLEEKISVLAAEIAVRSQAQQKQIDSLESNEEQRKANK